MPIENETKPPKTSIAATITAIATLLTALGGLIYALKTKDLSSDEDKKTPTALFDFKAKGGEKIYRGNVGKLKTTFNLAFNDGNNSIKGSYYYNKRQDQLYQLTGAYSGDEVQLTEYTKGSISATCVLKKDENGCLSGKMFNNDGVIHLMNICN